MAELQDQRDTKMEGFASDRENRQYGHTERMAKESQAFTASEKALDRTFDEKKFSELARHNKAIEAKAAGELNLKQEDRKALSSSMNRYMSLISFRAAMGKDTQPEDVAKVDADINGVAASMAQFGIKMPGTERKGDPLSSIVAGARMINDSLDTTDEQKKEATDTVSSALRNYGSKTGSGIPPKYQPGQILEKKDGTRWQVDVNGVPQRMK